MSRGPFCPSCAHEYQTKDRKPDLFVGQCPYCGAGAQPIAQKPFYEFSKSQIEKWGVPDEHGPFGKFGCPTRFFYKYILHLSEPKNEYAEFGIFGHALGENWMLRGEMPQINSLASKSVGTRAALSLLGGIPHMPPPSLPGIRIESEFHYDFEGVRYMGYKDVWAPLSSTNENLGPMPPDALRFNGLVGLDGIRGGTSLVGDWKFVSRKSFDTYTPIPEKLATDLQATIEGFDDVRRGASDIWLNWVFMPRGERLGKPVRALIHPDTIVPRMREINSVAKEMLDVLRLAGERRVKVSDMRTNAGACNAYGQPCPRLSVCHVQKDQQITASVFAFAQNIGEKIMQGFPGQPAPAATGALGALVASLPGQAPAPPVAAAQPHPDSLWRIEWRGQPYDVMFKKIAEIQATVTAPGEMKVLGPVQQPAPVAPAPAPSPTFAPNPGPTPAMAVQPAPVAQTFAPQPATAPAVAATPGKRGRKPRAVPPLGTVAGAANLITDADNSPDDGDDDVVDAFNHVFEALHLSVRLTRV